MIKIIRKIAVEPLFHFLLLGGLFYLYYNSTVKVSTTIKTPILISSQEIQQMKIEYKKNINDALLQALIKQKYYEKVLLDKAYSIKLAQNDKIITKRLIKQMEFVMSDSSADKEPTEEELLNYYNNNRDDYSFIESISFVSIFFSNTKDKRVETTYKLLHIADVNASDAHYFSEKSPIKNDVQNYTSKEIKKEYGTYFTKKLFTLKKGLWHKAIRSKNGVRLVYITDKNISKPYPFDEVQDRVYNDYLQENREKIHDKAYKDIASKYILKSI